MNPHPDVSLDPCPLCGCRSDQRLAAVSFAEIWRALAEEWGVSMPEEVRARYTPQRDTALLACERCDLQYFSPHNAGGEDFYEALMAQVPYERDSWEFGVVAERLASGDRVIDYGCGDGAFLATVAGRVERAVGVDLNQHAVAALQARGVQAFRGRAADFAAQSEERFDVACAFQVVEHLTSVDELLGPLCDRLVPEGRVFISVPNRDRLFRHDLEPMDCPPHHVSRWSAAALERLAGRYGLELARIDFEPPVFNQVAAALDDRLERHVRALPRVARRALRSVLVGPRRHRILERRGWWTRHSMTGHTMLVELHGPGGVGGRSSDAAAL